MYTNVSDDFLTAVNSAEPVYCCKLDFGNNVTVNDLFSVSYSGGSCSDSIAPGGTVIANAKVELSALPATVRKRSTCTLYFGVGNEYAPQGAFTVKKIEKSSGRLTVTLEDNMAKTEKGYFSSLAYPSSTLKMLSEIAAKCGVTFDTSGLTAVAVKDKPEGYTCREIIGYIAGLYGKFAVCDRTGKINFKWFDATVQLSDFCYDTPTLATDDITVGRVVCGDFTAGTGTAITYDCLFMTQTQLNAVQKSLNGFKYRTGEIPLRLGNMLLDPGDMVSITYGGETVNIPAAVMSMTFNGGLSMTIEAPAEEQSADSGESYKSPAQKQAERITADIISAKQALLEKADITELNAQIANLENVYAAKADITELTAQIATIDNLTAKKADIEQLYAKKADIDTLVADTATLKSLKADVANIDVLLSGKTGTGELTTIKLTAENAEIASALIKDLTAANFRSKTIETDDFTIKSSSGKLQIVGNTIQIKDVNNTVRVQIGEDGKSDYGIYVTDADGKIMFTSYDGLHEDGIKSGIIKNDMVADDAHISGSKLDISSIIDGINADDSAFLNTSKVVIDGTSQTINAKFTELTTSIGSIGTRTSALESDLSGFRTTVSETYATKSAVDGIQIGGRNLLYYSRFDKKYPAGWAYSAIVSYTFDGNAATLTKSETTSRQFTAQASVSNGVVMSNPNLVPENGCTYTISCEVMKAEGYDVGNGTKITNRYIFTDGTVKDFDVDVSGASETAWTKYSRTYTYASDKAVRYTQFIIALGAKACGIRIKNVKFEKGNKATDWSPAPEDTAADITALSSKQSSLEQTVNGFKTTVENTYATKSSLTDYPTLTQMKSAIDQNADSIKTTVSEQIAGISVGGRNLLLGTGTSSTIEGSNTVDQCFAYHDLSCGSITKLEAGEYTCYADIIGTVEGGTAHLQFFDTPWETIPEVSGNVTVKPVKQRMGGTFVLTSPQSFRATGMRVRMDGVSGTITVSNMKLERSNKATDWSPAPEDVTTSISEVRQTADKISWLVKSGTSASSMTLTSKALEIIANTKIKGDVIVGGVIKSTNYAVEKSGTKLSLSDGSWDSKNFKIDANGNITINGGKFKDGMVSDGGTFVSITKTLINNVKYMGRLYGNTLALFNHDDNGTYSDGGLYLSAQDGNASISTAGSIIKFATLTNNGNNTNVIATISYTGATSRLYMPTHFNFGTDESHACVRQQTTGTASADFVKIGNSTQSLQLIGSAITSTKAITTSSDARVKNHISGLPIGSENLFDYLDGKSFFYNGDTLTAKNYGFIAQDVLSALQKCGLSTDDFAGFCDIHGDGSQYALAYEQFIPLMWNEIKRLRKALSERS